MAGIQSSTGLISGIDIQGTIDKLLALSARPRDRLISQNAGLQNQQVAVGQLTALVIGVQLSTDQLGRESLYSQTKVQSSSSDLTATSTGTAQPGRYQFVPLRQSQQQQFTSSALASSDQLVGAGKIDVHAGGFLDQTLALDELNGGAGVGRGQIRITDRSGTSVQVDLRFAQTAGEVVDAINGTDSIKVTAKLDGDRFTLIDTSGGNGTLSVSEIGNGTTARDLGLSEISVNANSASGADIVSLSRNTALRGLLDGRGVRLGGATSPSLRFTLKDGSTIDYTSTLSSGSSSLGQLIDTINTAADGKLRASINSTGEGIQLEDLTSGTGTLTVTSPSGNLAKDLGWDQAPVGNTIHGSKLQSGLGDVLLSSLNGGTGTGALGSLTLKDRSGATSTVDLSSAKTIGNVLSLINASGIGVTARLNDSRTGITLVDTSGGSSFSLSATSGDSTAAKLGLTASTDPTRISGSSLQRQWIHENSKLADWNQGKGVNLTSFQLVNSAGKKSIVNFAGTTANTIGDVIKKINSSVQGVEARINETGDGLLLVDTAGGTENLVVTDLGSGTTAKQLRLAGTSQAITLGGSEAKGIDGSLDFKIETTATTTVAELVTKINQSGDLVRGSLLNLGNGGVRLALSSGANGSRGRISLNSESLAIGFSETAVAQDALLSVGGSTAGGGVLVSSSSNTFENVAPGVSVTINDASREVVTVDVTENSDAITKQLTATVDQFNKLREKLSELTSFDTGNFQTGALFGTSEALRIDLAFSQIFSGSISGASTIRSIAELGISYNEQGKLDFNKDKLQAALKRDPEAVKKFFTTAERGFSAKAKAVTEKLTGVKNGALLKRTEALQARIDLNNARVEGHTKRLENERNRLLKQFNGLEATIAKLQSNLSAINKISALPTI